MYEFLSFPRCQLSLNLRYEVRLSFERTARRRSCLVNNKSSIHLPRFLL